MAKILPRKGDRVRIDGLKGAKEHNGKFGSVKGVSSLDEQRYKVGLEGESRELSIRLTNISVCSSDIGEGNSSSSPPLHVLIPCHVETDRRVVTFMRCARSVAFQCDANQQQKKDFSVFVGLSGPEKYCTQAFRYLIELAQKSGCRWYIQDEQVDARPQLEHLRCLFLRGSVPVDSKALITFVDNDDMCHPLRFHMFMEAYTNVSLDDDNLYTLQLTHKLLLHSSLTPSEGQLQNFVNPKEVQDFTYWRRNSFAPEKVQLANSYTAGDLDGEEYFDFLVPSEILEKFFALNPTKVTSNKFSDLRLLAVFDHLCPYSVGEVIKGMWLLAHYKIPMDDKRAAFDRHGERDTDHLVQSVDQASFQKEQETSADLALANRFPRLSPGQVAMCRGSIESHIIQFVGWNEEKLESARSQKTMELNMYHGFGFGEALWDECLSTMLALFDPETLEASKDAWDKVLVNEDDF